MAYAHNGDVTLYYEEYGPASGPLLVMIEGYTAQLVGWERGFVAKLNDLGIRTVLLDNRDVGWSSQMGGTEDIGRCYNVKDMADDVVAVAEAAGASEFHIIGESMGGMIAQEVLANHADRVRSATIMFTTPDYADSRWMASEQSADSGSNEGLDVAGSREEAIDMFVSRERACHVGSAYRFDEAWARELGGITYDRCYRPDGWRRQNAAIEGFAADERALAAFDKPVALIHGKRDPFFSPESAVHLSRLFPCSELHLYPGMAHEVPEPLWDEFAGIIARTVQQGCR